MYTANSEIDLTRDAGRILYWDNGPYPNVNSYAAVLFDDGETWTVSRDELKPLVDKKPPQNTHLHFGCIDNSCPEHNSNRENEG